MARILAALHGKHPPRHEIQFGKAKLLVPYPIKLDGKPLFCRLLTKEQEALENLEDALGQPER